jgi:putative GTP pyrophosphokinase
MESTRARYDALVPQLKRLANNIGDALMQFISDAAVDIVSITYRIKTFESFAEKASRKPSQEPCEQVHDLCGLRVILFYPGDLPKVEEIIQREFSVTESTHKTEALQPDQFGYRSDHYLVRLRDAWLSAPNYRGLGDLNAEIQVRTILMHAWASLSHQLSYKTEAATPAQFRRQVYQLSALFELADQEFDRCAPKRPNCSTC